MLKMENDVSLIVAMGFDDVDVDDVVIGSGCSGVLELALTAMLDEGTNMLVPKPGFPLYQVIADSHGASVKEYRLDPAQGWECDLADMEAQIDANTRGILINNPSNPCGSVFSEAHLQKICELAEKVRSATPSSPPLRSTN